MLLRLGVCALLALQLVGLMMLAAPAFADSAVGLGKPPEHWALATSISRSNSLYDTGDGNASASVDFALVPMVIINKDYTLTGVFTASQDLKKEEWAYGKGAFTLSRSGFKAFNKRVILSPSFTLGLPVSEEAQNASLQASTKISGRLDVNRDYLLWKQWGINFTLGVNKNWHQYDTAKNGTINTQYSASEIFGTSWDFNDQWSIKLDLAHYDTISYQGVARDYLSHSQEIGYKPTNRLSFAAGHAWGNPYVSSYRANGQDINLALNDETNSFVYLTMGFLF